MAEVGRRPDAAPRGGDEPVDFEASLTRERYYRGTIIKLHHGSQRGVIRTTSGRLIPFTFLFVSMIGPKRSFNDLHVGLEVGFDVSNTSHGLRVSVLRIPDEPNPS